MTDTSISIAPARHEALARRLRQAYGSNPVAPLRDGLDPTDGRGAYEVQETNTRFWTAQGRRIVGRKIGLTAKSVQMQLGVDQPDYGVLKTNLHGPDVTPEQVFAATAYAVPAIEIVDSRIADWKITFADTVADNGSSAFFVLGDEAKPLAGLDLYTCGMALEVNGAIASIGAGAACLGHPLKAAAWLARTLQLRAGDVVLTGALGPMVALAPGDRVKASIGGLGSVSFTYGVAA